MVLTKKRLKTSAVQYTILKKFRSCRSKLLIYQFNEYEYVCILQPQYEYVRVSCITDKHRLLERTRTCTTVLLTLMSALNFTLRLSIELVKSCGTGLTDK